MRRTYRTVKQEDQTDCGAAALASVALFHGMKVGVQQMRDLAGTDREGTNLLGLVEAAESLGFSARAVKGPFEALADVPLPAIAHVVNDEGLGHFIVVFRISKKHVAIGDPARGTERISHDEFREEWTGRLVLLTREQSAVANGAQKAVPPMGRLLRLLRGHIPVLAQGFLCAILMTALGLSTSYFVQHLIDSVLVRNEQGLLNALGIGMVLILVFRTAFSMLRQYLLAHVSRKLDLAIMSAYARHILCLPMRFYETRRIGEILSRVNDASRIREAISGTTLTAIVDGVIVIMMLAVLFVYDIQLALLASAFTPLLVIAVLAHHPAARKWSREAMEAGAQYSAHLVEDISGVETIKAFGRERERAQAGDTQLVATVQSGFSLEMLGLSMSTTGTVVTGLAGVAVLWFGGHRVMEGALTIGQLMFFYTMLAYLLEPLSRLASLNLSFQEALVAVDRLYQIMDIEVEPRSADGARFTGLQRAIELEGVDFRYGARSKVLNEVELCIPAGKTTAIVGESGSGKSTLLKLLQNFYQPTAGRVLIDGTDLRDLSLHSLRRSIGVVSQEPYIFNGTIRENIAFGMPGATLEDVVRATQLAGLDEFVNQLPDRYATQIGERGANLSGGQRQRLAIARALLPQPEVLMFDEATSHLDTTTEQAIQGHLRQALQGKTVVVVAHRLSTIRAADQICVMDNGTIVEQGDHDQLLAQDGRYAQLWQAQTAGSPEQSSTAPENTESSSCSCVQPV